MNKTQKDLALEIVAEKQADGHPEILPTVLVRSVQTLIILINVAKLFTNDKVDVMLNRLSLALTTFIDEAGV